MMHARKHPSKFGVRRGALRRAAGFTLVEMLVSLAVLSLALTVVGVVFAVTTKTATQAAAYSEVQNWVRQLMLQLEEDLRNCDPSNSVLVLVGRVQPAALTNDDLQAGKHYRVLVGDPQNVPANFDPVYAPEPVDPATQQYSNPRADILMFFANRPTVSQAPPRDPKPDTPGEAYASGTKFAPIQVVYGHAAQGQAVWDASGGRYNFPDESKLLHIEDVTSLPGGERSALPANRWHLARRQVILEYEAGVRSFKDKQLGNVYQRITRCMPDEKLALAGDAARLDYTRFLELFGPDGPGAAADKPPRLSPYKFPNRFDLGVVNPLLSVMYFDGRDGVTNKHHVATVIENPPVELRSNLGIQMLPGCVWFQVELLMPEDARNSLDYADPVVGDNPGVNATRYDLPRWVSVEPGATYVFVPDTAAARHLVSGDIDLANGIPLLNSRLKSFSQVVPPGAPKGDVDNVANRRVRMWPYAIRVTVRAFDPRGRLAEPVMRTLVHRFE